MNVEKELEDQPDLVPSDSEMLLSMAKLIAKINLCSSEPKDENFLACDLSCKQGYTGEIVYTPFLPQ